jgi:serine/threonine-protein kinase HipA
MVATRKKRNAQNTLALYMNGERVGTWRLMAGEDTLEYADNWVQSPRGRPISLRFPFAPSARRYTGREVHDYFENLLPDTQAIRERLAQQYNVGATDAFSLLSELGRDCVGALQILPEGEAAPETSTITCTPVDEAAIAAILRNAFTPAVGILRGDRTHDVRLSIAGAQEKTALLWHKRRWNIPTGTTPTTHIFKLPLGLVGNGQLDMWSSIENEWVCAKLMQAYGLPTANCEIGKFEDQKALIVERFDRRLVIQSAQGNQQRQDKSENWIARLPQEDFCQATGTSYLKKYQADGGPSIDTILEILRNSTNAQADRACFFKCQFVFWLLAAIDGHGKNFSLRIEAGGAYALTPFYDVLSAYPVMGTKAGQLSPMKTTLAMGIRGEKNMHYRLGEITLRHWHEMAKRNGLSDVAMNIITQTIDSTPAVIEAVRAQLPDALTASVGEKIFRGLNQAAKAIAKQLS